MGLYDIDGVKQIKEVWVDNYSTIEAAIADGDIINFTAGKTYAVDHSIVISKACTIRGNGCLLEAEAKEPTTTDQRAYYYIFDVQHDDVIIDGFNAVSDDLYPWQNGPVIYPDTITSNVYFCRVSGNNVRVSNISTDHLCGAVRVADDQNSESFTYHDVQIDNITCLDGTINVYIGNVVRCTASNLTLSTNVHNDTLGHAVYISRGTKHVSVMNFTIYNNYGQYGGLSIHPSSSQDETLTTNIVVSNGTIRSIADGSYGVQITDVTDILISGVKFESLNGAKAVSISQTARNITFNGCDFDGSGGVIRCAVWDDQQNIVFSGCNIRCAITAAAQAVMAGIQGMTFIGCHFYVWNGSSVTEPNVYLFSTHPIDVSEEHGLDFVSCYIEVLDDVKMRMLQEETSLAQPVSMSNIVVVSAASVGYLFDSNMTYVGLYYLHNIIAKHYTYIYDAAAAGSANILVDDAIYARSAIEFNLPSGTTKTGRIIGKFPNIVALQRSSGQAALAVLVYNSSYVLYVGGSMDGITITKAANSSQFTIQNSGANAVSVSVK